MENGLKTVYGNLLNETKGILVHGVNCKGRMGAGIALEIKKRYPQVYQSYIAFGDKNRWRDRFLLGEVDFVKITDQLVIANAFTQEEYGSPGTRYASYDAIDNCFSKINRYAIERNLPVKYPKIGAGLAGGCWDIIAAIIQANRTDGVDHTLFVL
jgi:O-acetyl-ADP-ribose deacetylase (regulator of RNase III)